MDLILSRSSSLCCRLMVLRRMRMVEVRWKAGGCIAVRTCRGPLMTVGRNVVAADQEFDLSELSCWSIDVWWLSTTGSCYLNVPIRMVVAQERLSWSLRVSRGLPIASSASCLADCKEKTSKHFHNATHGSCVERCDSVSFSVLPDLRSSSSPRWDLRWR